MFGRCADSFVLKLTFIFGKERACCKKEALHSLNFSLYILSPDEDFSRKMSLWCRSSAKCQVVQEIEERECHSRCE